MGKLKEELQKVYDECTKLYYEGGSSAVHDHVIKQQDNENPLYETVTYKHCTACDTGQPTLNNICLVCSSFVVPEIGREVRTIAEIKKLINGLGNRDIARLEACDENGDVEDLYPMYIDVIEGIELLDGTMVNEVRFCQMPNTKPEVKPSVVELFKESLAKESSGIIVMPTPDIPKIEKWAEAMSETLYEMRAESDLGGASLTTPNTGNAVPHEFIESTVDDVEHIENMKEKIRLDIVHHLTQSPCDYLNDKGEYEYQSNVYDFSYVVDSYIEQLYEDQHNTKDVWVCPDCGSDNVQFKTWTNANTMTATNEECPMEDGDCYCKDCESTSQLIRAEMMPKINVQGFQVVGQDGSKEEGNIHPDMKASFCVYNLEQANEMLKGKSGSLINNLNDWRLLTIWSGDVETPTLMFEGNVR